MLYKSLKLEPQSGSLYSCLHRCSTRLSQSPFPDFEFLLKQQESKWIFKQTGILHWGFMKRSLTYAFSLLAWVER